MEEKKLVPAIHKLSINNRKDALLTGVVDVISFDTEEILVETSQGMLMIKGKELHVKRLTLEKGELELDGSIDSLIYSDVTSYARKGESLLKRLFK